MSTSGVLILYASQTGNAESVSKFLLNDNLSNLQPPPRLMSMQAWVKQDKDLTLFAQERHVVLVVSTTGQGDVPDNGRPFLRQLKKMEKSVGDAKPFSGVTIYSLGLGDTNYDKFCGGLKAIDRSLLALGAARGMKAGYADDGTCLETVVEPWRHECAEVLSKLYQSCQIAAVTTTPTETTSNDTTAAAATASASASVAAPVVTTPTPVPAAATPARTVTEESKQCNSSLRIHTIAPTPAPEFARPPMVLKNPAPRVRTVLISGDTDTFASERLSAAMKREVVCRDGIAHAPLPVRDGMRGTSDNTVGIAGSYWDVSRYSWYKHALSLLDNTKKNQGASSEHGDIDGKALWRDNDIGYVHETPLFAPVALNVKTVASTAEKECRQFVTVRVAASEALDAITYATGEHAFLPGDCLSLLPSNNVESVDCFLYQTNAYNMTHSFVTLTDNTVDADEMSTHTHIPTTSTAISKLSREEPLLTHAHIPQPASLLSLASPLPPPPSSASSLPPLPLPPTFRDIFARCVDLHAPVKRALLRALADTCTDARDASLGLWLCSKAGKASLDAFIASTPTLEDLHTVLPSVGTRTINYISALLDHGTTLTPRSYSIASSPLQRDYIELCMRVHAFEKDPVPEMPTPEYENAPKPRTVSFARTKRPFRGLCGNWLRKLATLITEIKKNLDGFATMSDFLNKVCVDGVVVEYSKTAFTSQSSSPSSDASFQLTTRVNGQKLYIRFLVPFCIHRSPQFYMPLHDKCDGRDFLLENPENTNCGHFVENISPECVPKMNFQGSGNIPLVLIGPGTGITPLMSFIRHKVYLYTSLIRKNAYSGKGVCIPAEYSQSRLDWFQNTARMASTIDFADTCAIECTFPGVSVLNNTDGKLIFANKAYLARSREHVCGPMGSIHVYTGNRHRNEDVLYLPELLTAVDAGIVSTVAIACSRETTENISIVHDSVGNAEVKGNAVYNTDGASDSNSNINATVSAKHGCHVQDLLALHGNDLASLLCGGACVYVCGDATSMAKSVQQTIETAIGKSILQKIENSGKVELGKIQGKFGNNGLFSGLLWERFCNSRYHPDHRGTIWDDNGKSTPGKFVPNPKNPYEYLNYDEVLRNGVDAANSATSTPAATTDASAGATGAAGSVSSTSLTAEQRAGVWARALVMRMVRENQYKQDVWG